MAVSKGKTEHHQKANQIRQNHLKIIIIIIHPQIQQWIDYNSGNRHETESESEKRKRNPVICGIHSFIRSNNK